MSTSSHPIPSIDAMSPIVILPPMKQRLFLLLLIATASTVFGMGCKSDSGSREFIPGKGWRST